MRTRMRPARLSSVIGRLESLDSEIWPSITTPRGDRPDRRGLISRAPFQSDSSALLPDVQSLLAANPARHRVPTLFLDTDPSRLGRGGLAFTLPTWSSLGNRA